MASKPFYRTLRGLDAYSDRFCRLLIRRLTRRTWLAAAMFVVINVLATFMTAFVWAVAGGIVVPLVYIALTSSRHGDQMLQVLRFGAAAVIGVSVFVFGYRRIAHGAALSALREALRPRIIDGSRCMICRYSLEGLTGRDHLIVCPECGRTVPIGLGAVDLVEQMMARGELPPEGRFAARPEAGGPSNLLSRRDE